MTHEPFRPFRTRPNLNPKQFDPSAQTFVPDLSLDSSKIRQLSVRRIQMLGAKVYNSATQSIADDGAFHDITFDTKTFDQGNLWRASDPKKLTIPYDGIWTVSAFSSWAAAAAGLRRLQLFLNGTTVLLRYATASVGGGDQTDVFITSDFKLTAGDTLKVQARQNSGGGLNIQDGEDDNFFSAVFRGPV